AIELLIITSVVAIVAVFATPILSNALFPSDFQRAIDITESSVEQARVTARYYKTDVLMQVQEEDEQDRQAITLVIPTMQTNANMNEVKVVFLLPAGVRVVTTEQVIRFNPDGEIELPAQTMTFLDPIHDKSQQLVIK
ncbi:MAG: hypothetical protein MUP31_02100, partial [Xanthomonadales bacterium]|nr:hypothetical protein [Xanthomonadales bacterium]